MARNRNERIFFTPKVLVSLRTPRALVSLRIKKKLESKSGNNLDDNIGKWHNRKSDTSIDKSYPCFLERFRIAFGCEKVISNKQKHRNGNNPEKSDHISFYRFEEIIFYCHIRTRICTIFSPSYEHLAL